jgi:S-adenosylmethionine uptake transporter
MRSGTSGLGVGLYLTGVFLFALNDALGKWLVADYGVGQLMMLRSIGSAFVLVPMVFALRPALLGVVIALRPSSQMVSWASPLALFGATMFALGQTLTRKLRGAHWLQLTVWQFAGGGLIGAATIPWAWTRPYAFDLGLMALVGIVSMLCFILITRALALARAAVLAPLQYSAILWASLMGWLVWRDAPTLPIIAGNAVIIGGGLYLAARGRMEGDAVE